MATSLITARNQATFKVTELINLLNGGEQQTKKRKEIGKKSHPDYLC